MPRLSIPAACGQPAGFDHPSKHVVWHRPVRELPNCQDRGRRCEDFVRHDPNCLRLCADMADAEAKPPERRRERRISSPEHRAAYQAAKDHPMDHKPRLITSRSVAPQVHGAGAIGRFNTWLAVNVTRSIGTMWAAYIFTLIAIGGAVAVLTESAFWVSVSVLISQTFLQLVLLPIIIVGQNVISASQDARAEADHLTLTTLHAINVQQLEILQQHRRILDLLEKRSMEESPTGQGG